jgi:hypothetical protein
MKEKIIKETTDNMIHLSVKTIWGIVVPSVAAIITGTLFISNGLSSWNNVKSVTYRLDKQQEILIQYHKSDSIRAVTYQAQNKQDHKQLNNKDSIQLLKIKQIFDTLHFYTKAVQKKTLIESNPIRQEMLILPDGKRRNDTMTHRIVGVKHNADGTTDTIKGTEFKTVK